MGEGNQIDNAAFKEIVDSGRAAFAESCHSQQRTVAGVPVSFPAFHDGASKWRREQQKGGKDSKGGKGGFGGKGKFYDDRPRTYPRPLSPRRSPRRSRSPPRSSGSWPSRPIGNGLRPIRPIGRVVPRDPPLSYNVNDYN